MKKIFLTIIMFLFLFGNAFAEHENNYPSILQGRFPNFEGNCKVGEKNLPCEVFYNQDGSQYFLIYVPPILEPIVLKLKKKDGKLSNVWKNKKYDKPVKPKGIPI